MSAEILMPDAENRGGKCMFTYTKGGYYISSLSSFFFSLLSLLLSLSLWLLSLSLSFSLSFLFFFRLSLVIFYPLFCILPRQKKLILKIFLKTKRRFFMLIRRIIKY